MVIVLSLLISAIFSFFFFAIDLRYFSLFPILFALLSLSYNFKKLHFNIHLQGDFNQYSLYLIWWVLMIGLSGVLLFLWIEEELVFLILIGLNLFLRIWSFIVTYDDGKKLFEVGTYILMGIFIFTIIFNYPLIVAWNTISLFIVFLFWFLGFLNLILTIWFPLEERFSYQFFIFWILVVIFTLIQQFPWGWIWLLFSLIFLTWCYFFIKLIQKWDLPKQDSLNISVRRILAWERINKKITIPQWKISLKKRISNIPHRFTYFLELPNLILLLTVEIQYFYSLMTENFPFNGFVYMGIIAIFLLNYYLLKKINFVSKFSSFAWALVINFSIYFALLSERFNDLGMVLPALIIRTFFCKVMLFYLKRFKWHTLLDKQDYRYRTIATCIASIINVILLFRLSIPGQLLFSLIFFYIGIDLLILHYIFKFLKNFKEKEPSWENIEQNALS